MKIRPNNPKVVIGHAQLIRLGKCIRHKWVIHVHLYYRDRRTWFVKQCLIDIIVLFKRYINDGIIFVAFQSIGGYIRVPGPRK